LGKRTAIAKGARRLDSRLGGVFDLLNQVEVVFYQRSRLDLVSQGSLLEAFGRLKSDMDTVSAALSVASLLDRLLSPHQPEERAYALFGSFLRLLEDGQTAGCLRLSVMLKLLTLLGHRPRFCACIRCGEKEGPFVFASRHGGLLCQRCSHGEGAQISRGLARTLDFLLCRPLERAGVIKMALEEEHLAAELVDGYVRHLALSP
jgi:DNA repair protein RecO (recombination protein O)